MERRFVWGLVRLCLPPIPMARSLSFVGAGNGCATGESGSISDTDALLSVHRMPRPFLACFLTVCVGRLFLFFLP